MTSNKGVTPMNLEKFEEIVRDFNIPGIVLQRVDKLTKPRRYTFVYYVQSSKQFPHVGTRCDRVCALVEKFKEVARNDNIFKAIYNLASDANVRRNSTIRFRVYPDNKTVSVGDQLLRH